MIEAYITNLGRYNEGYLISEPLEFPTTTEEVQALLKQIGVDGVRYESYFITEYKTDIPGLHEYLGQYESIDELNYLASLLDDLEEWEREKFAAAVDLGEHNSVRELINLAQNLECYEFYPGVKIVEDLGRYLIDELGWEHIPESLVDYFDYEAYGSDFATNEGGDFYKSGYVSRNDVLFVEHYSGNDDLPEEHRIFAYPEPEKSIKKTLETYQQTISKSTPAAHERPHPASAER